MRDFQGMGGLHINEERMVELAAQVGDLKNSEAISGRNEIVNIQKELKERNEPLAKLQAGSTNIRTRLAKRDQEDYIIDLNHHLCGIEKKNVSTQRKIRTLGTQEWRSSRIMKSEDKKSIWRKLQTILSLGAQGQIRAKIRYMGKKSFINTKRGVGASSYETEIDRACEYHLPKMLTASLES